LYADPLFQPLIKDTRFQAIKMKARTNYRTYRQIEKAVEEEALQFNKEKPFGMMKALYKIMHDPLINDNRDEKALLELLRLEENVRDRGIAFYRLARIRAKHKDTNGAKKYLDQFKELIASDRSDRTGFVAIVKKLGDDLFANDPLLKDIK
jgi:hypothetical protein